MGVVVVVCDGMCEQCGYSKKKDGSDCEMFEKHNVATYR